MKATIDTTTNKTHYFRRAFHHDNCDLCGEVADSMVHTSPTMPPVDNIGVHFAHCYTCEYESSCKYGDSDCPATPTTDNTNQPQTMCEAGTCGHRDCRERVMRAAASTANRDRQEMNNSEARKIVNRLAKEARVRDSDRLISEALRDTLRTSSTTDRYYDCPTTEIVPERGRGAGTAQPDSDYPSSPSEGVQGQQALNSACLETGDAANQRPTPQFGSARGLVLIADDAFAESVCSEIDSVLADPRLDFQDRVLEAERLRKLRCAYCDGLGYFTHHGRFVCEACNGSGLQAESLEQVEARIQARYDEGDAEQLQPSPLLCAHANEVPGKCPCGSECYCKSHTCRLDNAAERTAWSDRYPEARAVLAGNQAAIHLLNKWLASPADEYDDFGDDLRQQLRANRANDANATLNLLRDLEQRVQAVHRCGDAEQARLLLVAIKGILNREIRERERRP